MAKEDNFEISKLKDLRKLNKEDLIILIKNIETILQENTKTKNDVVFDNRLLLNEISVLRGKIIENQKELIKLKSNEVKQQLLQIRLNYCQKELIKLKSDKVKQQFEDKILEISKSEKEDWESKEEKEEKENDDQRYEHLVKNIGELKESGLTFSQIREQLKITNKVARNLYAVYRYRKKSKEKLENDPQTQ